MAGGLDSAHVAYCLRKLHPYASECSAKEQSSTLVRRVLVQRLSHPVFMCVQQGTVLETGAIQYEWDGKSLLAQPLYHRYVRVETAC